MSRRSLVFLLLGLLLGFWTGIAVGAHIAYNPSGLIPYGEYTPVGTIIGIGILNAVLTTVFLTALIITKAIELIDKRVESHDS